MKRLHVYTITALLLLPLCCAGFTAYSVGQPAVLDTTVVKQATGRLQTNPVVAGSNSSFMAVWVDMRDAGNIQDLFAAHLSPTGAVLDPGNIRLTSHACVVGKPDICWNGTEYFVVYANAVGPANTLVYAIRVSADGTVLSQTPIMLSYYSNAANPRASWDGTNWVVVWSGDAPGAYSGVYAVRVSPAGVVLDTTPITVAPGVATWDGTTCANPAVASTPDGRSLVVWSKNATPTDLSNDLYAAELVGDTGHVNTTGMPVFAGTTSQDTPDACWAGDHFKVVWADGEPVGHDIRGMRFDNNGVPIDAVPWIVSAVTECQFDPQIAWNGSNCIVTWTRRVTDGTDIYAARLDDAGAPLDGAGLAVCSADGRQARPSVALMSGQTLQNSVLVCWTDDRASVGTTMAGFGIQVVEAVVNVAGGTPTVGAEVRLAESAPQHKASCSAYNGQKFLACWEEWTEGGRALVGTMVDANTGQPFPVTPFCIAPLLDSGIRPSAIWNGESFVVFWTEGLSIKAVRVSPTGTVLDPIAITVIDGTTTGIPTFCTVATDGNNCLIAYRQGTAYHAALVSRSLAVLTDRLLCTASSATSADDIGVCWAGQYYIVAWKHPTISNAIAYTTVEAAGALGITRSITDASKPYQFRLAWNGQTPLLLTRGSEIHSYSGWNSVLRCFGTTPSVPSVPLVVTTNAVGQENLNFFWDGVDYVLTWNIANPDPACGAAMQYDLQFTRINSNNQLIGVNGVNVLSSVTSEIGSATCAGPTGRILAAFASYEDQPYQSARIKALFIDNQLNLTWLGQLRGLYEGAYVTLPNQIVSASFRGDRFYVQYGRAFGIGVKAVRSVAPGAAVTFTGQLRKINGETMVDAATVEVGTTGNPTPEPIGLRMLDLGGIAPTSGYTTVAGGRGLYNVGLLVKTWGRVTEVGDGYFILDDGSITEAQTGHAGIKVYGALPATGVQYVVVTGISGAELNGSEIMRVLRSTGVQAISVP